MDTKIGKGTTFSRTTLYFVLRLALDDPFAMRIAENHVFGKAEFEIRIQSLNDTITPPLVAGITEIKVEPHFFPALAPGTHRRFPNTPVCSRFDNFKLAFGSHRRMGKEFGHCF